MAKGTPNGGINGTLANGLLTHWCFIDGSLQDISGNGNDLSGVFVGAEDKDGKSNQALYFNNKRDIRKNGFPYPSGDIINISFWFKASDINSLQSLFCLGDIFFGQAINVYQGKMQNGNTYGVLSDVSIEIDKWTNICIKINKQTNIITWYKNGVYISQNATASFSSWGNNLCLGWTGNTDYPHVCQGVAIDEIRFYGRDLEDSEIAEINTIGVNYDTTPLAFNIVNVFDISGTSVKLKINCNENATAYYKLYNKNATAPTSEQLRTSHDGTIVLTANVLSTINIVGLTSNSDYDLYVVAEDTSTSKNMQIEPTKVSFFTITKGTPNAGQSGTLANGLLAHLCFNDGSLQDISGNGNKVIVVGTPRPGVDKDGQAGQSLILNNSNYIYLNQFLQGNTNISGSFIFKVVAANTTIMAFVYYLEASEGTFYVMSNGNLGIYSSSSGGNADTGINILDNKYHQLLFISDSTGTNLYLDKKYIGKFIQKMNTNVPAIYFGKLDISGGDLNIDEIRFYNRRLTGETLVVNQEPTDEIAEIFTIGANYQGDVTPPTFNTINVSDITTDSVNLNINCNEDATAYYKLYDKNATAPTPDELKTTHDGIIALTANNLITKNITGLTALKDYDLYVVAEDTSGNLQATPSLLQFNASLGKVATPTTDSPSGTYENGKIVTLNCATPGAEIRFTIDGSEPTEISQLYLTPLEVAESKQVRVKAYKTGYFESDTLTLNYIIIGGNSMLGLPTVLILFKTALSQAIEQGETGVLAVILKDASVTAGVKEYKMTISTDIPSALSDDNKKALQLAFEGKPKMVKAVVIPATATDYTAGLEYLEAIEFNVMTIPYIETADVNAVKLWAIGVYENKSTKIIAVLPKSAADHPAVVNWTQDDIVSSTYSDTDMDANESIAGIAGLIAGLPLTIAPTYQMPTWIDDAPKMTEAQANTRVGAGELFIYSKQGKNKVARGVTSLITPTTTYPEQFKKIKLVRIYNKIYTDLKSTIEDYYIGKVQNSYDNIVQLINVINGYFELLEQVPILEARQNSCEIDVASKKAYLESVGVDTSKLTEQQIKEYNAGDKVFLKCTISALDSMETFNIIINI